MTRTILVAGASGALGRQLIPLLRARGHRVRALVRDARRLDGVVADEMRMADALSPSTLSDAMLGVDTVFSAVGASVFPRWGDRRRYGAIDTPANLNLLGAAREAHVRRFVYVAVCHPTAMAKLDYIEAHEAVVNALRTSGLAHTVLRPTGFFSALGELLVMARKGPVPLFGEGATKSNPIHDLDLAEQCAEAIDGGPPEIVLGGPEVLTRREMTAAAFAALGKTPAFRQAPVGAIRAAGALLRPFNPRLSHLVAFVAALSEHDVIAPCVGTRRLGDYFKQLA